MSTATAPAEGRDARAAAAVAVVLALVAVVLGGGASEAVGTAGRLVRGGLEAQVDGQWRAVARDEQVPFGTRVRTAEEPARLTGPGGALELGPGSEATLDRDVVSLDLGSVLVEDDDEHAVVLDGQRVRGRGTWRVDLGTSPRVAVYAGGVAVRPLGTDADQAGVPVGRLRQRALVGLDPGQLLPQAYRTSDPWDARLLSEAVAVDRLADTLGTTLAAEYGTAPRPDSFYADFAVLGGDLPAALAVLDASRGGDGIAREPGRVLLAAIVAQTVADGTALPALEAVARVDELRRAGATWGLVLRDADLTAAALEAQVGVALQRRREVVAERGGAPTGGGGGPTAPSPQPTPTTPPTTPPPGPGPGPTEPSDPPSPPPDDRPGPLDPLPVPDPVEDLVEDVVDVIDDLLGPDAAAGDPPAGPVTGTVDDLVGGGAGGGVGGVVGGVVDGVLGEGVGGAVGGAVGGVVEIPGVTPPSADPVPVVDVDADGSAVGGALDGVGAGGGPVGSLAGD